MSIQEAAERLRKCIPYGGSRQCEKEFSCGAEQIHAEEAVVKAYLAEHPVDDTEPVTEEWLRSVGFGEVPSDMGPTYENHFEVSNSDGTLNLWNFNDKCWLINGFDSFPLKTRGDVRRLCAVLGIELKETV